MSQGHTYLTLGDLRKHLNSFPDNPNYNSLPLIYSHDDEGNEFQAVNSLPSVIYIEEMKYRDIDIICPREDSQKAVTAAIIIN